MVLPDKLNSGELIYICAGSIPNRKSTPIVDEWFGLSYECGRFVKATTMNEVVQQTGLRRTNIPNPNCLTATAVAEAEALLPDVVNHAKEYLGAFFRDYQSRMNPLIDEEIDKLSSLEDKHKAYQLSLFESERKRSEQERKVDELFDKFTSWVTDTLTIEDNPYIRIIAVLRGV